MSHKYFIINERNARLHKKNAAIIKQNNSKYKLKIMA